MKAIEAYFLRQQRRLQVYRIAGVLLRTFLLAAIFLQVYLFADLAFAGLKLPSFVLWGAIPLGCLVGLFAIWRFIRGERHYFHRPCLSEVGEEIEKQIGFDSSKKNRGEIRSVGYFLETPGESQDTAEFCEAHIQYWNKRFAKWARPLSPSLWLLGQLVFVALSVSFTFQIQHYRAQNLPSRIVEWTPSVFEIQLPFAGAAWKTEQGALAGTQGARVRFRAPDFGISKTFLYVRESGKSWIMVPCSDSCEWTLVERGQYGVGTLFSRSSLFPLQVTPDEPPRGVLLVKVGREFLPSATIQAVDQEKLDFELTASDDIQIEKIEVRHRAPQAEADTQLLEWSVADSHFKKSFSLPLSGWKGGDHQIFLRMTDRLRSVDSSPVSILFADEETMRAKRISDMRGLLDEWVHILADLLESQADHRLSDSLQGRIRDIRYPDLGEASLMTAFIGELKLLGDRIQKWARYSPDFSQVKDLVERTEKAILYGLSLIFQEQTGEVEATSESLKASQNQLQDLLEKIKRGEMDINSQELEEAFKKLAEKLEELQRKVRELPSGPNDELINREGLQAQADESETLAKKIEEIKKQMASGDNKGAMRELESLMNQLSILSKEMQRSLDQWKSNLDQGAMQSAERYMKKLEELRKRQEELAKKTQTLKERAQSLESQNAKTWKPIQPEKLEGLKKEFGQAKKEQDKLSKDFKGLTDEFDQSMQGSEFEQLLRSEEAKETESQISERMNSASGALQEQRGFDALSNQNEAIELLKKAQESQKQMQEQIKQAGQAQAKGKESREKVEVLATESKAEKERRRKIMESLQQKVDGRFQKSHERYFEDLLQR